MGFSTEYTKRIATFHILDLRQFLLALLDYTLAELMVWCLNCPSSVVRVAIISEPIVQIPLNFSCGFPWAIHFDQFLKKKCIFKFVRIFLFRFRVNHVNMGTHGSQNFKTLLLPQITFQSFQTFSEFSQWSSQKYCFGVLKFGVYDFSKI